ncbi:MAG: sigma-70 family RNA polymerase sigma factor [Armatimonadetes bacterium]|nr:sigma-70 family RNA polymerase sigma factor [Armatimonadota bacterium]
MMHAATNQARETDEELMARFQAGDSSAMEELFARFQKPLFNFFFRMVGRRETAEDLVQETFLKVCRFGQTFRGSDAKFTTWLFSIAGNQCRDYLRHRARRPETMLDDNIELNHSDNQIGPYSATGNSSVENHLIRVELRNAIEEAINTLPEKERTAIILREYHDMEYKEIADVLGCPIGSVKVLIFRARQKLKERLGYLKAPA